MPRTRPPYAPEFRQQMVDLVRAGRKPEALTRPRERVNLQKAGNSTGNAMARWSVWRHVLTAARASPIRSSNPRICSVIHRAASWLPEASELRASHNWAAFLRLGNRGHVWTALTSSRGAGVSDE